MPQYVQGFDLSNPADRQQFIKSYGSDPFFSTAVANSLGALGFDPKGNPMNKGSASAAPAAPKVSTFDRMANVAKNMPIIQGNQNFAQGLINRYAPMPTNPGRTAQFRPNPNLAQGYAGGGSIPKIRRATGFRAPQVGGLLKHPSHGRADKINTSLKPNSFVIPADVVSGIGGGNTESGGKILEKMFRKPKQGFAGGGTTKDVPVSLSGGEFVLEPHEVMQIGNGDLKEGLRILDSFTKKAREKNIKTLKSLKPPKK